MMLDRETLLFLVGLHTWIFIAGAWYAFPAWMVPLKAKFDLSQEVTLAIGVFNYGGFLVGLILSTVIPNAVRCCCFSDQWRADAAVFGVVNVFTCAGVFILRELFTSKTLADGAFLCMLSSAMGATGVALGLGIYLKHLLGVVAARSSQQLHTGAAFAVSALGGVVATAVAATIEGDEAWNTYFDVLFALTLVSGVASNIACGLSVKANETIVSSQSSVNESNRVTELSSGDTETFEEIQREPLKPRPPWLTVIKTYLSRREGWLVLCILLTKCFVGPVLMSRSTSMYKSARANWLSSETQVLVWLNVGHTIGCTVVAVSGLRESILGYDTTVVLNVVYGALFFIVSLVGSFELSELSILLAVTVGGFAYGMLWATDSPTFLKVAEAAADWPVLVCLASSAEIVGFLGGNFVVWALNDANRDATGAGTECHGLKCVQGTFVMMSVCSMCIMAASVSLAVRLKAAGQHTNAMGVRN